MEAQHRLEQRAAGRLREEAAAAELQVAVEARAAELARQGASLATAQAMIDRATGELAASEREIDETRSSLSELYAHIQGVADELAAAHGGCAPLPPHPLPPPPGHQAHARA